MQAHLRELREEQVEQESGAAAQRLLTEGLKCCEDLGRDVAQSVRQCEDAISDVERRLADGLASVDGNLTTFEESFRKSLLESVRSEVLQNNKEMQHRLRL